MDRPDIGQRGEMERAALIQACPRVLCLLDKNPFSPTYGSFDRKFWQYKIIDFPSGMQQELVLPLAYLWKNGFEGNTYHQSPRIAEYVKGAFLFHGSSCHRDGSLDDYFPFERAFGATAYALAALTEAAITTGLCPDGAVESLERSGRFLARYREAGLLSNHLAIAALALANLFEITHDAAWKAKAEELVSLLTRQFHKEGWFPEYGGCDPGYQTVTVEFLARYYRKSPTDALLGTLKKACLFLRDFVHPDGSLGGEYGSRNTYNFYPGGFVLLSDEIPEAGEIYSAFLKGINEGACNYLEDDGVFGHMLSSYTTVLSAGDGRLAGQPARSERTVFYEGAGLYRVQSGPYTIVGNTTKGGVCKIFRDDTLAASDTGWAGRLADGTAFCQNNSGSSKGVMEGDSIRIEGELKRYNTNRLGLVQMAGLRVLALLLGRLPGYSNTIRRVMQMMLIYKQKPLRVGFTRKISCRPDGVTIEDTISPSKGVRIAELYRSSDCVNMHVVTSDSFQKANLLQWERIDTGTGATQISVTKRIV